MDNSPANPEDSLDADLQVDMQTMSGEDLRDYVFVDVREKMERLMVPVRNLKHEHLPMSQYESWEYAFDSGKKYLFFCAAGLRSLNVVKQLRAKGISNSWSLINGAAQIDKIVPK